MPIQLIENPCDESICAVWHITESMDFFFQHVDLNKSAGFETVHHPSKQLQWLASRMLAKVLVEDYWNSSFDGIYNDNHGKPWLTNSDCHISISNSQDIATAILHRSKPVGIDIELIKPKILRIANKYLTISERLLIGDGFQNLTIAWCCKETIYKIHGIGNISLKEHIELHRIEGNNLFGKVIASLNLQDKQTFYLKYLPVLNYMLVYNHYDR